MYLKRVLLPLGAFLYIAFICRSKAESGQGTSSDVTIVLNKIFNSSYDKRVRPGYGESVLEIGVTMYIFSASEFIEKEERLTTEFYFRQSWVDARFAHGFLGKGIESITGNADLDDMIWKPDTFLPGSRVNLRSNEHSFVRIFNDGRILRSLMVKARNECPLNLKFFPYDTQICSLYFESFGYNANNVKYKWANGKDSVGFIKNFNIDDKRLTDIIATDVQLAIGSANYSGVKADLVFVRFPGHFFRSFYGPAIIFSLVTYASYFLPFTFASFRAPCLLSSVMVHMVLLIKAEDNLPLLDYSTRLDQYLITCLTLSVISLFEFFIVILMQKPQSSELKSGDGGFEMQASVNKSSDCDLEDNLSSYLIRSAKRLIDIRQPKRGDEKLDIIFKILLPFIFIIYNISYWASLPVQGELY